MPDSIVEKIVERVLVSEEELDEITSRLAARIDRDYEGKNLVLVCVLKGSVMFMTDLAKKLSVPMEMEFIRVSSYGKGTESSGKINMKLDFDREDVGECDFIIVEDIVDSGNTLSYLVDRLKKKGARSVKSCTLLDKPSRRKVDFTPDYVGKVIPDEFVFGYGLDLFEKYRDLPFVAVVKADYIEKHV